MTEKLINMVGITKSFPGVQALQKVDFDLLPGEVHCLVGENGAGKSTLMKILSGAYKSDEGEIQIEGVSYTSYSPIKAHDLGIETIYQETDLVFEMSVANNIFLGHEPLTSLGTVDKKELKKQTLFLMEKLHLQISPEALVKDLSPANRQLVQILKALSHKSKVLIMDEPGAVLSDYELQNLFVLLKQLKQEGLGIIYISHRLEEILFIGDRITVLRDGKNIITTDAKNISIEKIIEYMVGRPLGEQFGKTPSFTDEVVMEVSELTADGRVNDISFFLRKGEILGLAGLIGAGRSELLSCLFGLDRIDKGIIRIKGKEVEITSPQKAMEYGLGLIPEDRRESGLILSRSVKDNIAITVLDQLSKGIILSGRKVKELAEKFVKKLGIKTRSINQLTRNLSGGNQQKVVLAKWLAANSTILLLDEPTRGVDINAKSEIYHIINDLTKNGVSIIMASSELPEILGMSDRILVMAEGRITKEFSADEATQVEIMKYAVPSSAIHKCASEATN